MEMFARKCSRGGPNGKTRWGEERRRERERERGKREDEDESDGRRYVPEVAVECGELARSRELNAGDRRRGQERRIKIGQR